MDLELRQHIKDRLHVLAERFGTSEQQLVQQAVKNFIEDMEDLDRLRKALSETSGLVYSQEEAERELGFIRGKE